MGKLGFALEQPFLIAALFFIPLSTSLQGISIIGALLSILLSSENRALILHVVKTRRWCQASLGLFILTILGGLWSDANLHEYIISINKYAKFLYLPILAIGFRNRQTRTYAIHAFLLSLIVMAILSIVKYYGYAAFIHKAPDGVFRNHIMQSLMLDYGIYLCLSIYATHQKRTRYIYLTMAALLSYQVLCINGGRMGYILYVVFLIIWIRQYMSFRQQYIWLGLALGIGILTYWGGFMMQHRIQETVQDIQAYQHHKSDTAVGFRLQFHRYAYHLFQASPIIGRGTAGFMHAFVQDNPVPAWDVRLLEPHSQYWLIASEWGILGLLIYGLFLYYVLKATYRSRETGNMALVLWIGMLIGNVTDSLLFFSGCGYFFIVFWALCLGETV
jgi:O-antigen ligase